MGQGACVSLISLNFPPAVDIDYALGNRVAKSCIICVGNITVLTNSYESD